MNKQQILRNDSRKSGGFSSATGGRRKIENPDMFKNAANQSLTQNKLNAT